MWLCGDKPNTGLVMLTQSECWHEILSRHSCGLTHVWQISITFHQSYNNNVAEAASLSILTRGGHLCKLEHYWSICNPFDWGYVVQIFVALNTGPYHPGLSVCILLYAGRGCGVTTEPSVSSDIMMWRVLTGWHFVTLTGAFLCHTVTYPDSPEEGWDWAPC